MSFSESSVSNLTAELEAANALLEKKEKDLVNAYDIIQQIESKLECCESDFFRESSKLKKSKDLLNDEIKVLKESIKKGDLEHDKQKRNISESIKQAKLSEKEN